MTTYQVRPKDRGDFADSWYVVGLADEWSKTPDTMLLFHYRYPESETPDVGDPDTKKKMYDALYDLTQTHEGIKKGDLFETPFGLFLADGWAIAHVEIGEGPDPQCGPTLCEFCDEEIKEGDQYLEIQAEAPAPESGPSPNNFYETDCHVSCYLRR